MKHNSPSESSSSGRVSGSETVSGGVDSPGGLRGVRCVFSCCTPFSVCGLRRSNVNIEDGKGYTVKRFAGSGWPFTSV
jgi:hypothetical protein